MINYVTLPEFDKDFKLLLKRFKSLEKDFEIMKKYTLETFYEENQPTTAFVPMEGFCSNTYSAYKVRKFSCMALKGRGAASGIRVIFVWEASKRQVTFIEMYFKGDKANENRNRLENFIKNLAK